MQRWSVRTTFALNTGTNQLASVVDTAGTRSISYDGRGNTIGETRPGSGITVAYDGFGRLTSYQVSGGDTLANEYNGFDDRITGGTTTDPRHYVYDLDGRMMGEYGSSYGDVKAETIWLSPMVETLGQPLGGDDGMGGYAPLAVATPAGLNWVYGNHLGVPILITDNLRNVVMPTGYTPVGFPGQTRTLADLYYNRYRDYDSTTGRYIQADPIGLTGGLNPYTYAENNPINFVDRSGTCVEDACIGEGAFVLWCAGGGCEAAAAATINLVGGLFITNAMRVNDPEALREWKEYKAAYAAPMPPGLDPCEQLAWKLKREQRLLNDRIAWDAKWFPGRHDAAIEQTKSAIRNIENEMKRQGCKCP